MDEPLDGERWWLLEAAESVGLVAGLKCAQTWALAPATRAWTRYAPIAAGTRIREVGCSNLAADMCMLESIEAGCAQYVASRGC